MNVWLKRIVFGLVVVLIAAVVGLAIFLLTFNPNAYKSRLEQYVYDHYSRTLTINGDIGLSLFPRIGLSLSDVALSNRNSRDIFLSVDSARFAVAIWPLLTNHLVVDHVAISGLQAWLVRDQDGRFNFSDLLESRGEPAGTQAEGRDADASTTVTLGKAAIPALLPSSNDHSDFTIDIAGLDLKNGRIHYLDQRKGLETTLSGLEASTGRVTYDQPFDVALRGVISGTDPVQDARMDVHALLQLHPGGRSYAAQKINVQLAGRLGNLADAHATLTGNLAYKGVEQNFAADDLNLNIKGEIRGAHPIQDLQAKLAASHLRLDQRKSELSVSDLALRASGDDQGHTIEVALDAPALAISPDEAKGDAVTASVKRSGDSKLAMAMELKGLAGNAHELQFHSVSLDSALTQGERLFRLTWASPMTWDTSLRKGALTAMKGDMEIHDDGLPDGVYQFPMIGSVHLDLVKDALDVDLNAVIDGSQAAFKSHTTLLPTRKTEFSLDAEKLDLNRWLPVPADVADKKKKADAKSAEKKDAKASSEKKDKSSAEPTPVPVTSVADRPIRLSFLRGKDIAGDIHIDDLRLRDVQLQDVSSKVRVQNRALKISDLSAKLYDGTLSGLIEVNDQRSGDKDAPSFATQLKVDQLAMAPFLQAVARQRLLSGHAAAQIDLKAHGNTLGALERSLGGRVHWDIRKGELYGVNVSQSLSEVADALIDASQGQIGDVPPIFDKSRHTPFSRIEGRLDLKDGQGQLVKLSALFDLLRITQGKPAAIDIPKRQLDVMLNAKVTPQSVPSDAKVDLKALRVLAGTTLPVHISGPWDHPSYAVQWSDVSNRTVKQVIRSGLLDMLDDSNLFKAKPTDDPESDKAKTKAEKGTADKAADAGQDTVKRIGDALKGLLGQ